MDFFAAQAAAKRRTRRLLVAYALAVGAVVAALTFVVLGFFVMYLDGAHAATPSQWFWQHPLATLGVATAVLGVIGVAALHRTSQLSSGGGAVAAALGGVRITRETQDPRRRRLLNVVEEMAIASGVPVPEVYVLEQENAINAFAAGFQPTDAAIAVTRGALERLNRDQLQGVIGHEFSHILNGDMRLNTRLAGPLFGLLVIAIAARNVMRVAGESRSRKAGPFVLAALAVMLLGYLGVWLGRLLQAAICRQREFLADASSVQFTRDTTGLRDALVTIARSGRGSRVATAEAEDLAHAFIASAYDRWFATHPPLRRRVAALDRRYDLGELEKVAPDEPVELLDEELLLEGSGISNAVPDGVAARDPRAATTTGARGVPARVDAGASPAGAVALAPGHLAERVANPGLDAVRYAAALRTALPPSLTLALARGTTALCVWLAVSLAAHEPVRRRQLEAIERTFGPTLATATARFWTEVQALPVVQRLPLLQRALPTLATLPRERRAALAALGAELAGADGRIDVLEFLLSALSARYLRDQLDPDGRERPLALADCRAEIGALFAVVAFHGHADAVEARRAYERGLATLLPRERPEYAAPDVRDWASRLAAAIDRLDRLAPAAKEPVVEALALTIAHDGMVTAHEAELLRAACALLHCPLPPLLAPLES